jgi:pimeloyl-ACP methyl ester carboxylesterase
MSGNARAFARGPHRIRRLVSLEGLSIRDNAPEEAPGRYAKWLGQLRERQRLRDYGSFVELAERLRARNPRLGEAQALFLARHWGRAREDGRIQLRSDPLHKIVNPTLYRSQELKACLRNITAPALWVQGAESDLSRRLKIPEENDGAQSVRAYHRNSHLTGTCFTTTSGARGCNRALHAGERLSFKGPAGG